MEGFQLGRGDVGERFDASIRTEIVDAEWTDDVVILVEVHRRPNALVVDLPVVGQEPFP
jgi:hypothetical protein